MGMTRLTTRSTGKDTRCGYACAVQDTGICCGYSECYDCIHYKRMIDRLGAYEDTGLEPEEIEAQSIALAQCRPYMDALCDEHGKMIINPIHLRELVQAERDGRLVVLPCKVGDTVYVAETAQVAPLTAGCVGGLLRGADGEDWESLKNFGKTVFLSCKEAKVALKGGAE